MSDSLPHILITNDDGVHAPGLKHLWKALSPHAHVTVVAPAHEQSAVGLSTTIRNPLHIERVDWGNGCENVWSVSGTPADCVKLALNAVLKKRPDMVVSGINRGGNLGCTVLYSGTVAAAIESTLQDIPAVAFSSGNYINPDYITAERYIPSIIEHVRKHPLPLGTLLNVNFPECPPESIKGFKMTTQGKDWWKENPDKRLHPIEGSSYYWLAANIRTGDEEGDGSWYREGYITAVPIHVANLTDINHLKSAQDHFERLTTI